MDPNRLDDLAKVVASSSSRRQALKAFGASALALIFSGIRGGGAEAHHNRPCRDAGANCSANAECCTGFCIDFHCACPPDAPNLCPGKQECLPTCTGGKIFVPGDCRCVCPAGTEECGGQCVPPCPEGTTRDPRTCECEAPPVQCEDFRCGEQVILCGTGTDCLCTRSTEGLSTCGNNFTCGDTPQCQTSAECVAAGFLFCQAQGTGCCGQVCVPACGTGTLSLSSLGRRNGGN